MSNTKTITLNESAREKIKKGVDTLASTVGVTLGPKGRNVIIDKEYGPSSTKDGVSVAREINLKDPVENVGAQMVKEAASKTATLAGDGTTTATVLAQAVYNEGLKHLKSGVNPIELKRGMDKAVSAIVDSIADISKQITTSEEVRSVGTVSANNDTEIGNLIAEAMDKVGKEGVITVEESRTAETSLEIVEGMQFDRGYVSPYFVTDQSTMQATLEDDPYILLYDKRISSVKELLPILEQVSKTGKGLLIVCEDVGDEALAALIVNKVRGILKAVAVRGPEYGERRMQYMEDIATLTGATVITEQKGFKLEKATLAMLGKARTITVTKDKTTIVDGYGNADAITQRIEDLKILIDKSTSDFETEKLQERLGKLTGGVAILNIGAHTEVEMKEKKDRVDDALHATKAAVEEGIVPGGGVALLHAIENVKEWESLAENDEQRLGIQIIKKACHAPFNLIMNNAGLTPEVVKSAIASYSKKADMTVGYDVRSESVVNMFDKGIIDPAKVTRVALENAVSVASMLLTTEAVITKDPEEKKETAAPNMMY
jgi:chaperonin GroEL